MPWLLRRLYYQLWLQPVNRCLHGKMSHRFRMWRRRMHLRFWVDANSDFSSYWVNHKGNFLKLYHNRFFLMTNLLTPGISSIQNWITIWALIRFSPSLKNLKPILQSCMEMPYGWQSMTQGECKCDLLCSGYGNDRTCEVSCKDKCEMAVEVCFYQFYVKIGIYHFFLFSPYSLFTVTMIIILLKNFWKISNYV